MENICRHHNKNKLGTGKTYTIMYMNVYDNIYIFLMDARWCSYSIYQ